MGTLEGYLNALCGWTVASFGIAMPSAVAHSQEKYPPPRLRSGQALNVAKNATRTGRPGDGGIRESQRRRTGVSDPFDFAQGRLHTVRLNTTQVLRHRASGPRHLNFRLNLYARLGRKEQTNADYLRSLQHICFHGDADAGDAGGVGRTSCGGDLGWIRAA